MSLSWDSGFEVMACQQRDLYKQRQLNDSRSPPYYRTTIESPDGDRDFRGLEVLHCALNSFDLLFF